MSFGGWLRDPPSPHDWDARAALGPITGTPVSANARHLVVRVLNQGGLGSCVANAGMQALRAAQVQSLLERGVELLRAQQLCPLGSRLMGYYLSRATHADEQFDSGTYIRAFFGVMSKFGFCPESVWPYDPLKFARTPPHTAFRAAFDQRAPTTYRRVFDTGYARIDTIKQAVSRNHLVVFGTQVAQSFANGVWGDGEPLLPPVGERLAGGHAMCVTDFSGDKFGILNSWGTGWGEFGYCYFSADYLAWDQTQDIWIVESAPAYSE